MPDWENLVRLHLRGLELDADNSEEIIAEIAGHLEESFGELRRCGASEAEATRLALKEIPDWKKLRHLIAQSKLEENAMNERVKSLWIPGFFLLVLSLLVSTLGGILMSSSFPHEFHVSPAARLPMDIPWLITLPFIGALGAFWSKRMGGGLASRLAVSQFPIVAPFFVFFILLPVAYLLFPSMRALKFSFVVGYELSWVVLPSLALLIGALPFALRSPGSRVSSQSAA